MAKKLKDPFCSISHWVGLGLAVVGISFLVVLSIGKPLHLAAFGIYGIGLATLYFASAFYHTLPVSGKAAIGLQKFDHAAIYLMIAASYVPVSLLALKGAWGIALLIGEAIFMTTGIVLTICLKHVPGAVRVPIYIVMGWMAVMALGPMSRTVPMAAIEWLLAGGVVYTIGAAIYSLDKPHLWPGKFSAHDLWHLFVIAGSACHYVMFARFLTAV